MNEITRLPMPEIREETVFQHFTQNSRKDDSNCLPPPKRRARSLHESNFNRNFASTTDPSNFAHAVSFLENSSSKSLLSSSYHESLNQTYFEQCFTNISKLGEGSFGEVFKVRSKEDGACYAIKMSKQFYRSELNRQERLEEVRRYEQFSGHANCLRFYRAWEENDRLYMQMELCRESLEHYAERCFPQKIPEEKIWSILLDLLLALKSLHDRNLIHLDIKLDNVLIANDDTCKLADFGLVIDVDRANRDQATEGDSRYMAPEIMQGHFSKAADIFSLGIAILELSCYLKLPPNGPLWQQLRSGHLPEDFLRTISPELCAIIRQMMTPNPLERPNVNYLLSHRKFIGMLKNRRIWRLGRQFLSWCRTLCFPLLIMCQIKPFAQKFFNSLRSRLMYSEATDAERMQRKLMKPSIFIERTPTQASKPIMFIESTPKVMSNYALSPHRTNGEYGECFNRYQSTPIDNFDATPVNTSNHRSFRSRKDLTRTSFRRNSNSDKLASFSEISGRFLSFEELNSSSVCGKRLFDDNLADESD